VAMQVSLHYEKTDTLNRIRCSICRSGPCKCADDVEDECTLCNNVPCTCESLTPGGDVWLCGRYERTDRATRTERARMSLNRACEQNMW